MGVAGGALLVSDEDKLGSGIMDVKTFSGNVLGSCTRFLSMKTSCKPLVFSFNMSLHCLHCHILKPRSPLTLTNRHSLCWHLWFNIAA
jgi:hypothetical protein